MEFGEHFIYIVSSTLTLCYEYFLNNSSFFVTAQEMEVSQH